MNKLLPVRDMSSDEIHSAYSLLNKLESQLIAALFEKEQGNKEFWAKIADGESYGDSVTLTINESLPSMKKLTASMQEYWLELIHSAIFKSNQGKNGQKLPYFDKAFVLIVIITPKYSDNSQLWDTSNRAINLIINNLKGIFFEDDNHEHMAFGVVGKWGESGQTIVKIMPYERLENMANTR